MISSNKGNTISPTRSKFHGEKRSFMLDDVKHLGSYTNCRIEATVIEKAIFIKKRPIVSFILSLMVFSV